jgi:outer membrane protein TolC
MGAQAGTWRAEWVQDGPIPSAPPIGAADGPAGLLRRRPDVQAAEKRLIAANARIGQAMAEYYPKVSLAALIGGQSVDAKDILGAPAIVSDTGLGLRWRLFDFGRVDAEVDAAKGRQAEALAAYRAVVLKAGEEVEDAFSDLQQDTIRADILDRRIDSLTRARAQAQRAYAGGVASLIEVRDLDRDLLAASDQRVLAKVDAARAAVAAFRALGGGWSAPFTPS